MELTLALGRPVGSMPEREFARWAKYTATRQLPFRRLELGLAMLSWQIARYMGGVEGCTISDFLFDPKPDDEEIDIEAVKQAFAFQPRKKVHG